MGGRRVMFLIYDWLRESKSIGQCFFRIGILILCSIVLMALILGLSYVINKIIISSNENYILISMTKFNSIIIIILMLCIALVIDFYRSSMKNIKEFRFGWKAEKRCKIGFIIGLIMIISGLVYFCNNYYVFYNDKIEKHGILGTTMYSYKDIKSTNTGYKEIKYDKYLYYKVNFKNGESIDIANGLLLEPTEKNVVLEIDKIISKTK